MEAVVCQPHAEAERHEAVGVAQRDSPDRQHRVRGQALASGRRRRRATAAAQRQGRARTDMPSTTDSELLPSAPASHASTRWTGRDHRERVQQRAEHEQHREHRDVRAIDEPADARSPARIGQLEARRANGERNVVVRAGVHAVEAERAVDVADLRGQDTGPARSRAGRPSAAPPALAASRDAVRRPAGLAGRPLPNLAAPAATSSTRRN